MRQIIRAFLYPRCLRKAANITHRSLLDPQLDGPKCVVTKLQYTYSSPTSLYKYTCMLPVRDIKQYFFLFLKKKKKVPVTGVSVAPSINCPHPSSIMLPCPPISSSWKIDPFTRDTFLSSNPALLLSPTSSCRVP